MTRELTQTYERKSLLTAQVSIYSTLCVLFAFVPIALGWVSDWVRPILWLGAVLAYRLVEQSVFRAGEKKGQRQAEWLFHALHFSLGAAILLPAVEFVFFSRPLSIPLITLGFICVALGTWLRYEGVKTLGEHFSTHVEVRPDHTLVDTGIYHYIRHPSYIGVILFTFGTALILQTYFTMVFDIVVFWPLIAQRIRVEEEELRANLPGYTEYMRRTKRLIPFLI